MQEEFSLKKIKMAESGPKFAVLLKALEAQANYDQLSPALQQQYTAHEYRVRLLNYCVSTSVGYQNLPESIRSLFSEKKYYEEMVRIGLETLQLFPYAHIRKIAQFTGETPLSYYTAMVTELLKQERSYDTLPNFTAVDVLKLIGIGRNQFLDITKEVRSQFMWKVNRSFARKHMPMQLLSSVVVGPFWLVEPATTNLEEAKKLCEPSELEVFKELLPPEAVTASSFFSFRAARTTASDNSVAKYACEFPFGDINCLYRKGLVIATFSVDPSECICVPPLDKFVMNRTSHDPQEALLYKILSTIDDRTPLSMLARMLTISEEEACNAAEVYIRLGLAFRKVEKFQRNDVNVHDTWKWYIDEMEKESSLRHMATEESEQRSNAVSGPALDKQLSVTSMDEDVLHERKRIAFLFDATITGCLMMTNISSDPAFKQHAVTMFEAGKLTDEVVGQFLEKLQLVSESDAAGMGEEAERYFAVVLSLRDVLATLRTISAPGCGRGLDMLKVEAMNELEAHTRYTVLCRNYSLFFVASPVAQAPLLDITLEGVYGASIAMIPSPWMLLMLYSRCKNGPACVFLKYGDRVPLVPLVLRTKSPRAQLYALPVGFDSSPIPTQMSPHTCLLLLSEMTQMSAVFVYSTLIARHSDLEQAGVELEEYTISVPFTASSKEIHTIMEKKSGAHSVQLPCCVEEVFDSAVEVLGLRNSLGYLSIIYLAAGPAGTERDRPSIIDAVVTGVGLGFPLAERETTQMMLSHLPALLKEAPMAAHNAAMQKLSEDLQNFTKEFTLQNNETRSLLVADKEAHPHLRGERVGTLPLPSKALQFDGTALSVIPT